MSKKEAASAEHKFYWIKKTTVWKFWMKTLKEDPELFLYIVPHGKLWGQIFNSQASDSKILAWMNMEPNVEH